MMHFVMPQLPITHNPGLKASREREGEGDGGDRENQWLIGEGIMPQTMVLKLAGKSGS